MENPQSKPTLLRSKAFSTPEEHDAWLMARITEAELLKPGSPVLQPNALDLLLDLYSRTLDEIGPDRFLHAFHEVLLSSAYRPDIAEIRRAAGVNYGVQNPLEREASEALCMILQLMRVHGWQLREKLGKVVRTKADNGQVLREPEREPTIEAPVFADHVEAAIRDLGYGDRLAGLDVIRRHPVLEPPGSETTADAHSFRNRLALDVERQWLQAYMRAKVRDARAA